MPIAPLSHAPAFNLLSEFDRFMAFWQQLRGRVSNHLDMGEPLLDENHQTVENIAKYVHEQLLAHAHTEQQRIEVFASSAQLAFYQHALYAISAVIDEQILEHMSWDIQEQWLPLMLERALFGSRNAGSTLIDSMVELAEDTHSFSALEKQLALIYVRVIALGFDGKYEQQPDKLAGLQKRLLLAAEETMVNLGESNLFEAAYQANLNPKEQSRLAPFSLWRKYLVLAALGYLLIAAVIWFAYTGSLRTELRSCSALPSMQIAQPDETKRTQGRYCHSTEAAR